MNLTGGFKLKNPVQANRGRAAEKLVLVSNFGYRRDGRACVEKVPTEFLPLRDAFGKVRAVKVTHKAPVDCIGVARSGRPVAFDIKSFSDDRWPLRALEEHQVAFLADWQASGGYSFILLIQCRRQLAWLLPFHTWLSLHVSAVAGERMKSISTGELDVVARKVGQDVFSPVDWLPVFEEWARAEDGALTDSFR